MNKCVIINCNNEYLLKSIIALKQFESKNPDFDMYIIGTSFEKKNHKLCEFFNINIIEIDLSKDFIDLDKRPYGQQYPIECFYYFYAYKILDNYDYIVLTEPDIYTNLKLQINLNQVEYIAGGYNVNKMIKNFSSLMRDYNKIIKVYKNININLPRILGGVKIFNVKNLKKINFYEKIIELYKKSIEISAPRCGDDTLMVMYQMIYPQHVRLISQEFCVIGLESPFTSYFHRKIVFYHFTSIAKKYWEDDNDLNHLAKYFSDKMIKFVYDNFSLDFIKLSVPTLYKDISKTKICLYYYQSEINFGDQITPYFLKKFCNKKEYYFDFKNNINIKKIICCGSIMRLCDSKTIVYGAGIRDINQDIKPGNIQIVRGPLTRNRLLSIGCYCPPNYGDPGLLLPLYYSPSIKKIYSLGIIPHINHYHKAIEKYSSKNTLIIDLKTDKVEEVINQILSCEKIISSSLHGLIVSDAYNIPNKWIKFDNTIMGDDTKYYDYFKSVKRKDREPIDCLDFKELPKNIINIIKDVNIQFDKHELKENMFFDENGIKNYAKYLYEKIK